MKKGTRRIKHKKRPSEREKLPGAPLKEVQEATEKVIEQYGNTLRRLGKE